jgi:hypothetical protein
MEGDECFLREWKKRFRQALRLYNKVEETLLRKLPILLLLCVLILNSGCQVNATDTPLEMTASPATQALSTTESPTGEIQMTSSAPTPANAAMQSLIEKAKEDLAQRLSISPAQINLVELTEVEWSDSGLGCPQPGMDYLQVITPGYLILLEVNAQNYEYHSNRDTYFVYCEKPDSPVLPKP